jgi:hypothetical protein
MIFGILGAMVGSVTYAILAGLLRAFNRRYNARLVSNQIAIVSAPLFGKVSCRWSGCDPSLAGLEAFRVEMIVKGCCVFSGLTKSHLNAVQPKGRKKSKIHLSAVFDSGVS